MATKTKIVLHYLCEGDFSGSVYKDDTGKVWFDIEGHTRDLEGNEAPKDIFFSSSSGDVDGEPYKPMTMYKKYNGDDVVIELNGKPESIANRFNYMMLGRLKSDCENTLYPHNNCRLEDIPGVIAEVKRIWNELADKPEWLSMEEIVKLEELLPLARKSYDDDYVQDYSQVYQAFQQDFLRKRDVKRYCEDCALFVTECRGVLDTSCYTNCASRKAK